MEIREELKQRLMNYLGANYEKGLKNYKDALVKSINGFKAKHPYVDITRFKFQPLILQNGYVTGTAIDYFGDGKGHLYNINGTRWKIGWDINLDTFKYKYRDELFCGPERGVFQPTSEDPIPLVVTSANDPGFDITAFPIYVTKTQSFESNFNVVIPL